MAPAADPAGTDRRGARAMAEEALGRSARVAAVALKPLAVMGRLGIAAGLTVWAMGPAPWWESAPHFAFCAIALAVLLSPGIRLRRHSRRLQTVLDDLPGLVRESERAVANAPGDLDELRQRWKSGAEHAKPGLVGAGRRLWRLYRDDVRPLREENRALDDLVDGLTAFTAPALVLSGIAMVATVVLLVLSPIAVLVRLILLFG